MYDPASKLLLQVKDLRISRNNETVFDGWSFSLEKGDALAIVGPSGSGKTTLALALLQKIFYTGQIEIAYPKNKIAFAEQLHHFKNKSNTNDLYYQQRYHSMESDDAMTAGEYIGASAVAIEQVLPGLTLLLDEPLLQLSNGEHKKVQLAKLLLQHPAMLLLDQPFIGLDTASRQWLHDTLNTLAASGISIILITSPSEMPQCITHVLSLQSHIQYSFCPKALWKPLANNNALHPLQEDSFQQLLKEVVTPKEFAFEYAIRMEDVSVAYGDKQVLQHIQWKVKQGERWLLHGPNGAGKSTLLSLITADHPQAYANRIYLFDKRRGSGETIWDIKRQIGFVSPELHVYFDTTATCFETVASGLFDTIGLFRKLSASDTALVNQWLELFGFTSSAHKMLKSLSIGEQRLLLLARALIKNPPLLILDEPCQGLDESQSAMIIQWIDAICIAGNKTMVFVTHYQQDRPGSINKVLRLENGKSIE